MSNEKKETKEERLKRQLSEKRRQLARIEKRRNEQDRKKRNHVLILIGAKMVDVVGQKDMLDFVKGNFQEKEIEKIEEVYPDIFAPSQDDEQLENIKY